MEDFQQYRNVRPVSFRSAAAKPRNNQKQKSKVTPTHSFVAVQPAPLASRPHRCLPSVAVASVIDLPDEVLTYIFRFLFLDECLLTCSRVCSRWSSLIYERYFLEHVSVKLRLLSSPVLSELVGRAQSVLRSLKVVRPNKNTAEGSGNDIASQRPHPVDISPLVLSKQLRRLNLSGVELRSEDYSLACLSSLEHLEAADFSHTHVTSVAGLSLHTQLAELRLFMCSRLTDISALRTCTSVQVLDLTFTNVRSVSVCAHMKELRKLYIRNTSVGDLDGLEYCPLLETCDVGGTQIEDFSPLSSCFSLRKLDLSATFICSLDALRFLTNLRRLAISSCSAVTELKPLDALSSLVKFDCSTTPIKDITPLAALRLRSLSIAHSGVTDVSGLAKMTSLRVLDISHTPVSAASVLQCASSLRHLRAIDVTATAAAESCNLRLAGGRVIGLSDMSVDSAQEQHDQIPLSLSHPARKYLFPSPSSEVASSVSCPRKCATLDWISGNAILLYNWTRELRAAVGHTCTPVSCPLMCAGHRFEYLWADGKSIRRPVRLSAPMYIDLLLAWAYKQLMSASVSDTKSPKFLPTVKYVLRRLLRVYGHVLHSHLNDLPTIGYENTFRKQFTHHVAFCKEFSIVEDPSEYDPIRSYFPSGFLPT